ncbi:MAG TPA: hypothetical protein VFH55_04125 [Nitrospiria bacterium]|nr:hypothetical protein [Nitrospiria bacterium]
MRLKRKLFMLIAGALVLAVPILGWAMHLGSLTTGHPEGAAGPRAAEDIKNTLHNLSSSNIVAGINIGPGANTTAEVCVFCHTPHGANLNAPGATPLWNRTVPNPGGYTIYGSPNFDGTNSGQPQGVSLACLSCHDGTIALDSLINMPGSGGFRFANTTPPGGTTNMIAPAGGSAFVDPALNTMNNSQRTDSGPNYGVILGGAAPFPNLTTNLSDDHPISMQIPSTGAGPDPQFDQLINNSPAADVSGLRLLTRNAGSVNADKRDSLRSYPGVNRTPGSGYYIECASCHNPHAPRPMFLRLPSRYDSAMSLASGGGATTTADMGVGGPVELIADNPNAGSLVCLSCHQK